MPLIKEGSIRTFDTEVIHKGDLVRAQYHTWPEPRNGLLASVSEERLTVLFLPGLGNVSNYFPISAAEVAVGLWKVRWSSDLETVDAEGELEQPPEDEGPPEAPPEGEAEGGADA